MSEQFEKTLEQSMDSMGDFRGVAQVLDSFQVCTESDRFVYEGQFNAGMTTLERDKIRNKWLADHSGSENDICGEAWLIARNIREGMAAGDKAEAEVAAQIIV